MAVHIDIVEPPKMSVCIEEAHLAYGKLKVLDGLSMKAYSGSIYGLLGPSGCGKTSLIRVILGLTKVDSGSINVFGRQPGKNHPSVPGAGVGYMPQDISLFPDLSINETINYFAALYSMSKDDREKRREFLMDFLELPRTDQAVSTLSGGQKRRVSLATALIHRPPLLILDEPTVGVDPTLRKSIWDHLNELTVQDNLTILITTHYIEEAINAQQIGLMRHGRLLAQDKPDSLLTRFRLPTLEAVFLFLCTQAEANLLPVGAVEAIEPPPLDNDKDIDGGSSNSSGIGSVASNSMYDGKPDEAAQVVVPVMQECPHRPVSYCGQIKAMAIKNVTSLWRNKALMSFQLGLPTLEVILFCLCIGLKMHSIPVAVYDGDQSPLSMDLFSSMNALVIQPKFYDSLSKAIQAVKEGHAATALAVYGNFSNCLAQRVMLLGDVDNQTMINSTIHLYPDMSNQLSVFSVQEEVMRGFLSASKRYLVDLGISPNMLQMPLKVEEPVYGHRDPAFTEFMAPGVIASIAFLAAIPLTAMALVVEKKNGLIERTRVAGVSYFRILLSHLAPQTVVLLLQVLPLMLIVFPFFGIPYHGEFFLIMALTYLQSICGMCFGLFVSTIARDENTATMLALGFFYPNLLLSGTVWPTEAMNDCVRYIAYILPQTLPILSLRHMITKGWSIFQLEVVCGFAVTIFWIGLFLLASTLMARFMRK